MHAVLIYFLFGYKTCQQIIVEIEVLSKFELVLNGKLIESIIIKSNFNKMSTIHTLNILINKSLKYQKCSFMIKLLSISTHLKI